MIVTIVTPTLNGAAHLTRCIESIKRNRRSHYEIDHVIADGGSTDGTLEIAEAYGLRILYGKDRTIYEAINQGSFASSGDLIGCLCCDDMLLDGALEQVVDAYHRSGKRWVVGGARWIDQHGNSLGEFAAPPSWIKPHMHACLGWNMIMHMSTYLTRDFFIELNGFNTNYKNAADYEMFTRALCLAPFERISGSLACFRRTGNNNSIVNSAHTVAEGRAVLEAYGPRTYWEQVCWRYIMKAWVNARNPYWTFEKFKGRIGANLKFQEGARAEF